MKHISLLAAAVFAGICASSQASMITGVTATSPAGTFSTYSITQLTNGAGLTTPLSPSSTHDSVYSDMWLSNGATTGAIVFDLGQQYTLSSIAIWPYNISDVSSLLQRGVKTYSLDYSSDGLSYAPLEPSAELPIGTGLDGMASTVVTLPEDTSARYVRMNITENWGAGSYVGLSEVQFSQPDAASIPEPTGLAGLLTIAGGLLARKPKA